MPGRFCVVLVVALALVGPATAATIKGTGANDILRGSAANDRLLGRAGNDSLYGGRGHDRLQGGPGDDKVLGQSGNDRLEGGVGLDRLLGGAGNDVIVARGGGRDHIQCGPGLDRALADASDVVAGDCETKTTQAQVYPLAVSTTAGGSVKSSLAGIDCGRDCGENYPAGTAVTLTAIAASGWSFAGWSHDCSGTGACVVFLDAESTVKATFLPAPPASLPANGPSAAPPASIAPLAPPPPSSPPSSPPPPPTETYGLAVTVVGLGRVTSSPTGIDCGTDCSASYSSGTTVTLTAVPEGLLGAFLGWVGACTGVGGCTITMDADKTVTALFSA